jgi:hypothetical protein
MSVGLFVCAFENVQYPETPLGWAALTHGDQGLEGTPVPDADEGIHDAFRRP